MNPSPAAAESMPDRAHVRDGADHIETPTDAIATPDAATATSSGAGKHPAPAAIDLSAVDADFDGVEAALRRLDEGTYWTDEVTGEPIDADALAADPTRRRA